MASREDVEDTIRLLRTGGYRLPSMLQQIEDAGDMVDAWFSALMVHDSGTLRAAAQRWIEDRDEFPILGQFMDLCVRQARRESALISGSAHYRPGTICGLCDGDGWEYLIDQADEFNGVPPVLPCRGCRAESRASLAERRRMDPVR